jgi:hypothetical protein
MDMVGSSSVIEDAETMSLPGLEKPSDPGSAIMRELQEKFLFCAKPEQTDREILNH